MVWEWNRVQRTACRLALEHMGKPELPRVNVGEPQRAEGALEHATYSIPFESYMAEHGRPYEGC